jgi:hypothetical protein
MTILEANLALLSSRFPGLDIDALIAQHGGETGACGPAAAEGRHRLRSGLTPGLTPGLKIEESRTGAPTAQLDGRYIHSRMDPVREAERMVDREAESEPGCAVFLGFGLGYHVEAFRRRYPETAVIIIEADPALLKEALAARDMSAVFFDEKVTLLPAADPGAVPPLIETIPADEIALFRLRNLYEKDGDYYRRMEECIRKSGVRTQINRNTLRRFGRLWVRNLSRNLEQISEALPVDRLSGLFSSIPGLLLAAGPSLDQILPYVAELKKRMLVTAVDTALPALSSRGLEPDFAVIVDPQYWNTRHIDYIDLQKAVLVSESSTHPRVFRLIRRPCVMSGSLFPLGKFIEDYTGKPAKLGAGGSVSTTAWDLLRFTGCSPIYAAGLDLGFPALSTHCAGSFFEERIHSLSDRLKTAEGLNFTYLHDASPYYIEDYEGSPLLSDKRMDLYRWWFENQVLQHPETRTYSLCRCSAKLEGVEYRPMDAALALPKIREEIEERMNTLHAPIQPAGGIRGAEADGTQASADDDGDLPRRRLDRTAAETGPGPRGRRQPAGDEAGPVPQERRERITAALSDLGEQLRFFAECAVEALTLTERLQRLSDSEGNETAAAACLARLDAIDTQILASTGREIAGFLMQDVINEVVSVKAERNAVVNSQKLYRSLLDSARYHLDVLEKARRRFTANESGYTA